MHDKDEVDRTLEQCFCVAFLQDICQSTSTFAVGRRSALPDLDDVVCVVKRVALTQASSPMSVQLSRQQSLYTCPHTIAKNNNCPWSTVATTTHTRLEIIRFVSTLMAMTTSSSLGTTSTLEVTMPTTLRFTQATTVDYQKRSAVMVFFLHDCSLLLSVGSLQFKRHLPWLRVVLYRDNPLSRDRSCKTYDQTVYESERCKTLSGCDNLDTLPLLIGFQKTAEVRKQAHAVSFTDALLVEYENKDVNQTVHSQPRPVKILSGKFRAPLQHDANLPCTLNKCLQEEKEHSSVISSPLYRPRKRRMIPHPVCHI